MNPVTREDPEVGPADFVAPPPASQTPNGKQTIGLGIVPSDRDLSLIVLIPLAFGVVALLRARRWKRMVRSSSTQRAAAAAVGLRLGRAVKPG